MREARVADGARHGRHAESALCKQITRPDHPLFLDELVGRASRDLTELTGERGWTQAEKSGQIGDRQRLGKVLGDVVGGHRDRSGGDLAVGDAHQTHRRVALQDPVDHLLQIQGSKDLPIRGQRQRAQKPDDTAHQHTVERCHDAALAVIVMFKGAVAQHHVGRHLSHERGVDIQPEAQARSVGRSREGPTSTVGPLTDHHTIKSVIAMGHDADGDRTCAAPVG